MEGGIGVSRVARLANFRPKVSRFTFKSYGFSCFEMCHWLRVWLFCDRVPGFSFKLATFSGFRSRTVYIVN